MSRDQSPGNRPASKGSKKVARKRKIQSPMDPAPMAEHPAYAGDDADDPLRKEAAERARQAVQPGRPRE